MGKILRTVGLVLAVSAALLIAPGAASATIYSGSEALPSGTSIVGNNVGSFVFENTAHESLGSCTSSEFKGQVVSNPVGGTAQVTVNTFTFAGTGSEGRCLTAWGEARVSLSAPDCFRAVTKFSAWEMVGSECGKPATSVGLTLETAVTGRCHYSRSAYLLGVEQNEPLRIGATGVTWNKDEGLGCPTSLITTGHWVVSTAGGGTLRWG